MGTASSMVGGLGLVAVVPFLLGAVPGRMGLAMALGSAVLGGLLIALSVRMMIMREDDRG